MLSVTAFETGPFETLSSILPLANFTVMFVYSLVPFAAEKLLPAGSTSIFNLNGQIFSWSSIHIFVATFSDVLYVKILKKFGTTKALLTFNCIHHSPAMAAVFVAPASVLSSLRQATNNTDIMNNMKPDLINLFLMIVRLLFNKVSHL